MYYVYAYTDAHCAALSREHPSWRLRKLDRSLYQVHSKRLNNGTHVPPFTPKSPLQGDRDDPFNLEFAPWTVRFNTRTMPPLATNILQNIFCVTQEKAQGWMNDFFNPFFVDHLLTFSSMNKNRDEIKTFNSYWLNASTYCDRKHCNGFHWLRNIFVCWGGTII